MACNTCDSIDIDSLQFAQGNNDHALQFLCSLCLEQAPKEEATLWQPATVTHELHPTLVRVPVSEELQNVRKVNAYRIHKLETANSSCCNLARNQESILDVEIPRIQEQYEDAFAYQDVFASAYLLEADYDYAQKAAA